jgi:hypothetical protein
MWEAGERFPSQKPNSFMRCPCGEVFNSHRLEYTLIHVPHITQPRRLTESAADRSAKDGLEAAFRGIYSAPPRSPACYAWGRWQSHRQTSEG